MGGLTFFEWVKNCTGIYKMQVLCGYQAFMAPYVCIFEAF